MNWSNLPPEIEALLDEAAETLRTLLAVKPDFRLETIDETIRFKQAVDREHFLSGLREAGLES